MLVFRLGSQACALPLRHVRETLRPLPVEPLAGAPSFVLGVSVVRGEPVPVVDGERLLAGTGRAAPTRFLALRLGSRHVALAVTSVDGPRRVPAPSLTSLPALFGKETGERLAAIGTLDGDLFTVLHAARLVPDSVWAMIEASEA